MSERIKNVLERSDRLYEKIADIIDSTRHDPMCNTLSEHGTRRRDWKTADGVRWTPACNCGHQQKIKEAVTLMVEESVSMAYSLCKSTGLGCAEITTKAVEVALAQFREFLWGGQDEEQHGPNPRFAS